MPFTSETARAAGKKSKRGKAKISMSTRRFLYEMLNENKEKFRYMLDELEPRDFINTWLKLLPYINIDLLKWNKNCETAMSI